MWPFKPSPFLHDDTLRWHVDIVCWYLRHFGQKPVVTQSRLILPGPRDYRLGNARGEDLAERVFAQTKALAHLENLPVKLPFSVDGDDVYRMVVFSVRRLARAVVASAPERPPVASRDIRAVVDIVACMMGFGVFITNHAIIDTFHQGHKTIVRESVRDPDCILSESDLLFDLALFLTFRNLKPAGAYDYLEKHLNEQLKHALRSAAAFADELKKAAW